MDLRSSVGLRVYDIDLLYGIRAINNGIKQEQKQGKTGQNRASVDEVNYGLHMYVLMMDDAMMQ